MYKLSHQLGDDWVEHGYAPVFSDEVMAAGVRRLAAGVPAGDPIILQTLADCLEEPFFILYVLHTPCGEGEAGRYQSPRVSRAEVDDFISKYASFLTGDGRFDLWLHSPESQGTLVWDRHNMLYAYGPLDCFGSKLMGIGFQPGAVAPPVPHMHHYRREFDPDAADLLAAFEWKVSPLWLEDDQ